MSAPQAPEAIDAIPTLVTERTLPSSGPKPCRSSVVTRIHYPGGIDIDARLTRAGLILLAIVLTLVARLVPSTEHQHHCEVVQRLGEHDVSCAAAKAGSDATRQ